MYFSSIRLLSYPDFGSLVSVNRDIDQFVGINNICRCFIRKEKFIAGCFVIMMQRTKN